MVFRYLNGLGEIANLGVIVERPTHGRYDVLALIPFRSGNPGTAEAKEEGRRLPIQGRLVTGKGYSLVASPRSKWDRASSQAYAASARLP